MPVGWAAGSADTSPGSTITATPPSASAVWIAIRCRRGSWAAAEMSSTQDEHSANNAVGWVSWK